MAVHDVFAKRVQEAPDRVLVTQGDRAVTYREALERAERVARAFIGTGLHRGDRVAILSKNAWEFIILYWAAFRAGVVPVPLNYRLAPPEWSYIVNDSGAKLLIVRGESLARSLERVRNDLGMVERFLTLDSKVDGWEELEEWVEASAPKGDLPAVGDGDDLYQMYTSGTTGRPKGAVLTNGALSAHLEQLMETFQLEPGERQLVVMPLYHAGAAITAFNAIASGGTMILHEDFDPKAVVEALDGGGVAIATLVPAMIQACLVAVPDVESRRFEQLRLVVYGASPIAEQTLRRAMETFRCEFGQSYGMTETTAVLTFLPPDAHREALRGRPELLLSAGKAIVRTEVRVVDENDQPVPPGTSGQIVARGPQLMKGYWNMPQATEEALRGGWMHTGDAGILDEEGYVYIQDRVKDMIVSGGENIYPREIEDVVFRHPAVADAAVIGVPDEKWGETVKAIVVVKPGAEATGEDIVEFCRPELAGYKRPRSVDFLDELPRNPSGKVLKHELRAPYWKEHGRRVAGS